METLNPDHSPLPLTKTQKEKDAKIRDTAIKGKVIHAPIKKITEKIQATEKIE